ncbi:MAG: phytanoyl-CoA dioxygenase family protein [Pseudomonadota bacterium]
MKNDLTSEEWQEFQERGIVSLGTLPLENLTELQQGIDAIMLGTSDAPYDKLLMQLDSSSGDYGELGRQTRGFKGATLNYRKIQDLEKVQEFREYLESDLFRRVCSKVYGEIPIACFRAMFMNKPARGGTQLPWHQDRWRALDRDPLVTIWTALDDASIESGCLEIIPGSHHLGVLNPEHGSAFLTDEQGREWSENKDIEPLEVRAGDVYLLHNWVLHRSGVNNGSTPRRAFSVCYMEAATEDRFGVQYTRLFASP